MVTDGDCRSSRAQGMAAACMRENEPRTNVNSGEHERQRQEYERQRQEYEAAQAELDRLRAENEELRKAMEAAVMAG